ncbi:hypothetical protein [Marilutibacter maris]|uniref:hypothetical protein n=1 Tax=Marilutibacter maris TaxID=1605891 RepID=UPI0011AE66B5|nr:hypothetical protein [Lysobacter maris]
MFRSAVVLVGLWVGLVPAANAETKFHCQGELTYLALDASGSVNIAIDGVSPVHGVCNLLADDGYKASPESCKAMYATFLAVKMSERAVQVFYEDPVLTDCSQIAPWSKQRGYYYVSSQ